MSLEWIPISPDLDKTSGAFTALAQLPNASDMKPVPLGPDDQPFGTFDEFTSELELTAAAQLGFASVASASTAFKSQTITYAGALFTEPESADAPNGGMIYNTRWGAGLRAHISVRDFNASFTLNLANVAAAASAGLVSASYRIEAFGIMDRTVLAKMPPPGRFDDKTYKSITSFIHGVLEKNLIPKDQLVSLPFMILVDSKDHILAGTMDRTQSMLFAMRRIQRGVSLTDAVTQAGAAKVDARLVETMYRNWAAVTDDKPVPSDAVRNKANDWLKKISLD